MFTSLDVFQSAHASATRAAQKQAIVAENLAHSDTPGFKAMMLKDADEQTALPAAQSMHMSRAMHMPGTAAHPSAEVVEDKRSAASPNGNTVSIAHETLKSIEAEREHSRAMTVYQNALGILRTSIGRGR